MSAQNSSTQATAQDTHSESDIHARLFSGFGARSIRNRGTHVRLLLPANYRQYQRP